jgi:hypothetical protein
MMILYHEHDEDPEMRPEPISPEKRETTIVHMAAGLMGAYRYFREGRRHVKGGELFWTVKHGLRMTPVPAFGPTHTDEEIWKVGLYSRICG